MAGADPPDPEPAAAMRTPRAPARSAAALAAALCGAALAPAQDGGVRAAAERIDALVEAGLREAGSAPNPPADDPTFVRRAYLTVIGRTPTLAELGASRGQGDGLDRAALVDELLAAPGRASHDFNLWADLLRVQSRMQRRTSGEPYAHFLHEALARNLPYDELVRALLTADGPAHAEGQGATGYWLRDLGMPLDAMSNTMRVFLGTRMECAQCHDHPFDTWTQRQFYELAAFTAGMRFSTVDPATAASREQLALARELRAEFGESARQVLRRLLQETTTGIAGSGAGTIRLPKDYAYDDARPNQAVQARVPFGEQPQLAAPAAPARPARGQGRRPARAAAAEPGPGSRQAFAAWLTAPDNPRFTTVIVNRMWQAVFGLGLIEPVDDLRGADRGPNPALLDFLEALMRELRYDLVAFRRVLLHTRTFGRQAGTWDPEAGAPYLFPGPLLRRMSAEQVWDSLLGLAVDAPDASLADLDARARPIYERHAQLADLSADEIRSHVEAETLRTRDPAAYRAMLRERAAAARADRQGETAAARARAARLQAELRAARQAGDPRRTFEILAELRGLREQAAAAAAANRPDLRRASQLPQPAPPGHFVRQWGQSDREQIAASTTDANVPQALQLLNGVVDEQLLRDGSALLRAIAAGRTPNEKIDTAFRAILGRAPTARERERWRRDFARDAEALGDLVWTLVNSHEFRFVQ
jgi:hypothetical protein